MNAKQKQKHQERVRNVKRFASKNKLFLVIAVILCLYLIGNAIPKEQATYSIEESSAQTETIEQVQQEDTHWRFYPIDLWILVVGGGFCIIQILKEKKKARETLK